MAMGSINVPDDESIGNETKNKGQLSLFARQKGKPLPGQSVCAGQTLLSLIYGFQLFAALQAISLAPSFSSLIRPLVISNPFSLYQPLI